MIRRLAVIGATAGIAVGTIAGGAAAAATAAPKMTITSPAFARGEPIPDGFTCDGASASPPLRFHDVPREAKDLALIVHDPDAAAPGGYTHWVAWRLPRRGVPEETLPTGIRQGANGAGGDEYRGPCPPPGPAHHYVFTLYAVSKPIDLAAGATKDELLDTVRGTTVARARLIGTYARATN